MTQKNLFDTTPEPRGFYGQPLARKDDPPTSKVSAAEAGQKASKTHQQLAAWLSTQAESKTCREMAEAVKATLGLNVEIETLRKRAGELEEISADELGFRVVCGGVRKCTVTKKWAETYEVQR